MVTMKMVPEGTEMTLMLMRREVELASVQVEPTLQLQVVELLVVIYVGRVMIIFELETRVLTEVKLRVRVEGSPMEVGESEAEEVVMVEVVAENENEMVSTGK